MKNILLKVSLLTILYFGLVLSIDIILNELDSIYPIVQTKYGKIKGYSLASRRNRTFYAFKGIPYAAPPTGDLRFRVSIYFFILTSPSLLFSCTYSIFYCKIYLTLQTNNKNFKAPVPPKPWNNVRDAVNDGPICIQKDYFYSEHPTVQGKEDCLYLNVYTPKVDLFNTKSIFFNLSYFFTATSGK